MRTIICPPARVAAAVLALATTVSLPASAQHAPQAAGDPREAVSLAAPEVENS